jgi:preprotein translocase subunit SecA
MTGAAKPGITVKWEFLRLIPGFAAPGGAVRVFIPPANGSESMPMRNNSFDYPPPSYSLRPEKKDRKPSLLNTAARAARVPFLALSVSSGWLAGILPLIRARAGEFSALDDARLAEEGRLLGMEIRRTGFKAAANVAPLFAVISEVAGRTLGKRHFDCQFMGGWALLSGMLPEMETGEGKTLTATLAAGVAALAGIPVHVICVNDYLTERDAEEMGPLYRFFGLTVGCVTHDLTSEQRRAAYACDITYCCNKEVVFDYLRDKLALGQISDSLRLQSEYLYTGNAREEKLLLRGLHFAICDEADSLLVDEARTPLIISGSGEGGDEEENFLSEVLSVARTLVEGKHYTLDRHENSIDLTSAGEQRVAEAGASLGHAWAGSIRRNDAIRKALTALYIFLPDVHYLVRDGKVQIIDEYTGRLMPDRSWERGIHQFIELKERCEVTRQFESLARITYQRFFRRYLHLCGMTGTAREIRWELWMVYGILVVKIPTNRPLRRKRLSGRVLPSRDGKYRTILKRVEDLTATGRPVLIGTPSLEASERLGAVFNQAGVAHRVLNAKNDREEAFIVAEAGKAHAVTIATNMAGRGTDIKLGEGVRETGGLHVILSESHDAGRIDRQLIGRCARQGDPGTYEFFYSTEDLLLEGNRAGLARWAVKLYPVNAPLWASVVRSAIHHSQKRTERAYSRIRHEVLKQDENMDTLLSFSGPSE